MRTRLNPSQRPTALAMLTPSFAIKLFARARCRWLKQKQIRLDQSKNRWISLSNKLNGCGPVKFCWIGSIGPRMRLTLLGRWDSIDASIQKAMARLVNMKEYKLRYGKQTVLADPSKEV